MHLDLLDIFLLYFNMKLSTNLLVCIYFWDCLTKHRFNCYTFVITKYLIASLNWYQTNERFISNWWSFIQCLLKYNILKICSRQSKIEFLLAVSLLALYCGYNEAKDTKPILEEFRKDYSSITKACKAVGFVRDNCSTRGISLDFFTFLFLLRH